MLLVGFMLSGTSYVPLFYITNHTSRPVTINLISNHFWTIKGKAPLDAPAGSNIQLVNGGYRTNVKTIVVPAHSKVRDILPVGRSGPRDPLHFTFEARELGLEAHYDAAATERILGVGNRPRQYLDIREDGLLFRGMTAWDKFLLTASDEFLFFSAFGVVVIAYALVRLLRFLYSRTFSRALPH